jgi:glycogen operon protein
LANDREHVQERLRRTVRENFAFRRGHPLPLGATLWRGGVNFSVFSSRATSVILAIFLPGESESFLEFPLDPRFNRTGDVWHCFLEGLDPGVLYGYRMDREPNPRPWLDRFDSARVLLDPYAKSVVRAGGQWLAEIVDDFFDWEFDQPLNIPLHESLIYELHVRGYTRHPSSGVAAPGTFLALTEKIPHLQRLGVTAVELMPVHEFDETYNRYRNPVTGERLKNFWGYDPLAFLAPKRSYASGNPVTEFKQMVKAFHAAGIEVILDVVFNHTGELDAEGPTVSFRGIDNQTYYIVDPVTGEYANYSGCGNTVNCNLPVVRSLILDCLRYFVTELHVDGFRFDLASILGRGRSGQVLADPPLLERIAGDPVLANTKIIAEAWDAAGLYQVGSFPAWGRWAEWNGRFRDDVRRFLRGDPGAAAPLAMRLSGSPDLYQASGRQPYHSINFVTCHDGFTLHDLVRYAVKHNLENGQNNQDGSNENYSWNHGVEGPSADPDIERVRLRQVKNFLTLLLVADGTPMLLGGDELGRTQRGNNNAYCQDNEVSWVDWTATPLAGELTRFTALLARFRHASRLIGRASFDQVRFDWHGVRLGEPDWGWDSHSLAMHLHDEVSEHVYLIANAWRESLAFELPRIENARWARFVDTSQPAPGDIAEAPLPLADQGAYLAGPRSVVLLVAAPDGASAPPAL